MDQITWEHKPSPAKLEVLGVEDWRVWEKGVSTFRWTYDKKETCYFIEGEAVVTPDGGEPVTLKKGDYVIFPEGLSCTWEIRTPVRKYYDIG